MRHSTLALLLALATAASGQDAARDPQKADKLREAGVALFKEKKLAEAATKYLEAIAAYDEALGEGTEASARQTLVLRRAVLWCRRQAGDDSHLAEDLEAFLKTDAAVFGSKGEEDSVVNCLAAVLEEAGKRKDTKTLAAAGATIEAALGRWIDAAAKQERLDEMEKHLDLKRGGLMVAHAGALFIAGERAEGEKKYREAIAYLGKRPDPDEAAWAAQNCFWDMTQGGTPEDAAFFFAETLAQLGKKEFASVESYFTVNVRNYLKALRGAKRWQDGVTFLEAAIAASAKAKIASGALSEAALRVSLDTFLSSMGAWEKAIANARATADLAKAAGDDAAGGAANAAAARAHFAAGKADAALPAVESAVGLLKSSGDVIGEGRARVLKVDILCGLKKHDEAEKEAKAVVAHFEELGFGPGLTDARQARLRNAKAKGDAALEAKAAADLDGVSAAGGQGGESQSTMAPEDLADKAAESATPLELLEIRRVRNELKVRNLLSNAIVTVKVDCAFRHVNIDGVLMQVRGAEIAFISVRRDGEAPGTPGESSMSVGGVITHTGPEFLDFAQRVIATEGTPVVLDSALQIRRKGAK
jgi:hypothetical protein